MISALFVDRDSVYKTLSGVDCWDVDRNALNWPGGNRAIFHPPCRLWSMLRLFSTAPIEEKQLAIWAVKQVREWGGVLEHPAFSKLWEAEQLPLPNQSDAWGFTIEIDQFWFGHPSRKRTWLYCCGIEKRFIPPPQIKLAGSYEEVFSGHGRKAPARKRKFRSASPISFAHWLVEIAAIAQTESELA